MTNWTWLMQGKFVSCRLVKKYLCSERVPGSLSGIRVPAGYPRTRGRVDTAQQLNKESASCSKMHTWDYDDWLSPIGHAKYQTLCYCLRREPNVRSSHRPFTTVFAMLIAYYRCGRRPTAEPRFWKWGCQNFASRHFDLISKQYSLKCVFSSSHGGATPIPEEWQTYPRHRLEYSDPSFVCLLREHYDGHTEYEISYLCTTWFRVRTTKWQKQSSL